MHTMHARMPAIQFAQAQIVEFDGATSVFHVEREAEVHRVWYPDCWLDETDGACNETNPVHARNARSSAGKQLQ